MSSPSATPPVDDVHALPVETVAQRLSSDPERGLSRAEASARLTRIGPNVVVGRGCPHPLRLLAEQFADGLVLLLLGAALVGGLVLEEPVDAGVILAIVVVNAVLGFVQRLRAERALAAVPEGLPAAVTVTLAREVQRLAGRRAIVRRLRAVEALGAASVLCTDKTGTLTWNRIRVRTLVLDGLAGPIGELPPAAPGCRLAQVAALCNDAGLDGTSGDPLEVALLLALRRIGIDPAALRRRHPRLDEAAFDPGRRLMSTVHRGPGGELLLAMKGAPEAVLQRCTRIEAEAGPRHLDQQTRRQLATRVQWLAGRGLRTLAFAYRHLVAPVTDVTAAERDLVLIGLAGLSDELRPEAAEAVRRARRAGIRVVMVTGDHPRTAAAIGREVGVGDEEGEVLTGDRLARMDVERLQEEAPRYAVYARVDPADKVKIVRAWQRRGEVVAVTGDGVNDAPALRTADIGVAMGSGTDVSRESADLILADDNFATLVAAVEEGRGLVDNLRRVLTFLLTTNASELLVMTVGFLAFGQLGEPLLVTQILWINLATDGLPVLALAADPPALDLMRRPPRRRRPAFTWVETLRLVLRAGLLAAAALGAVAYGHVVAQAPWPRVQTMLFTTLVLVQLAYAFALRVRPGARILGDGRSLVLAAAASVGLQVAVVHLPPGWALFHTRPLQVADWLVVGALAGAVLVVIALSPYLRSDRGRRVENDPGRDEDREPGPPLANGPS